MKQGIGRLLDGRIIKSARCYKSEFSIGAARIVLEFEEGEPVEISVDNQFMGGEFVLEASVGKEIAKRQYGIETEIEVYCAE